MKFYVATTLSNAQVAKRVIIELEKVGYTCAYDWTLHGAAHELGEDGLTKVAKAELDGVLAADLVCVMLPGGRGTHTELGAALAAKKLVVLVDCNNGEKLDEAPTAKSCSFHHHPGIECVLTFDSWTEFECGATVGYLLAHLQRLRQQKDSAK